MSGLHVRHFSPASAAAALLVGVFGAFAEAQAAVVVSPAATQNMACSAGVCTPSAADAVLNVHDLASMLSAGDVSVQTAGAGGVQATDILIEAPLIWASTSKLSLAAFRSIEVGKIVTLLGPGSLAILTNEGSTGGALSFGQHGRVRFRNLSGSLTINGTAFTLFRTLKSLAIAIQQNMDAGYALADQYDASTDGTYSASPINAIGGMVDGLGNAVVNLKMVGGLSQSNGNSFLAPIGQVGPLATLSNFRVLNVSVSAVRPRSGEKNIENAAGLVGANYGTMVNDETSGSVVADHNDAGGLVYDNQGSITGSVAHADVTAHMAGGLVAFSQPGASIGTSSASGTVTGTTSGIAGGLVAYMFGGAVGGSYATGVVKGGGDVTLGGLAGFVDHTTGQTTIQNSYALGPVNGRGTIGGLIGLALQSATRDCYATGSIKPHGSTGGGYVGSVQGAMSNAGAYWNTTTSGTQSAGAGATNVVGLTDKQLKAGLPPGFDPAVWAESPRINGGLPYLIANPPS